MDELFLTDLREELVEPEEFWRVFFSVNVDEQNYLLDIVRERSLAYQTQLSNEALRKS